MTPIFSKLTVGCLSVFSALACADQVPDTSTLRIGVILAETGEAAFLGQPEGLVLRALAAEPGARFVLDIADSAGDPARAQQIFDAFAADTGMSAVIGPSTSAESLQLGARADALQLVMLSLAANKQIIQDATGVTRPYVFKFAQNDDIAAERLGAAMRANGVNTVAMLYSDDAFGVGGAQAFRITAGSTIQITADISYPAQLASAETIAAQVGLGVPAVIIWGTAPGPPLLVKALRARGYTGAIYLSHGNATGAFVADAGAAAEGAYVVGSRVFVDSAQLVAGRPSDDAVRAYQRLWARLSAEAPSTFGGHARDALQAILLVSTRDIRDMSSGTRRSALRAGLEGLRNFPGVTGTFNFSASDHAGLTTEAFELYRIQNGKFVAVR